MHPAVKIFFPLVALLSGASLALAGLLRPALFWDTGKLQTGRRMIGDGPMATCLIIFGIVIIGFGLVTFFRLQKR